MRLRYEFQVVPAPLLPWFIARTFALIPEPAALAAGAVLTFDDARAKVWATQDDRYVFATVAGDRTRPQAPAGDHPRHVCTRSSTNTRRSSPVEQWEHKGKWVPRETLEEFGVLPRDGTSTDARLSVRRCES